MTAGSVAIVTGGASGIGAATVRALADHGFHVAVVDKDAAGAARVTGEIERAHPFVIDLADTPAIEMTVDAVLTHFGRVDVLVNAAGISTETGSVLETGVDEWETILTVNLTAPFALIQAVGRHMVQRGGGGRIVNVGSSSAFRASFTRPAYASSKAALSQLTRTASADLAPYDINVNAVAPGVTATPMTSAFTSAELEELVTSGPLANLFGRVSTPEDVAGVIAFLCLPESRQITGQTIHVSAGAVI